MSASRAAFAAGALACWAACLALDYFSLGRIAPKVLFICRFYVAAILMLTPMVLYWDETRYAVFYADRRVIWSILSSAVCGAAGLFLWYRALGGPDGKI